MRHSFQYKNGRRLSYADFGDRDGFPILLQHGLIASIEDEHLFDQLVRLHARVISIARPGYGESSPYELSCYAEWADIAAVVIQELGLGQFDLLGGSSGAPYGYALGCRFPEQVRNIYILSGMPAMYDAVVQSFWPYPPITDLRMPELEKSAHEWFFANLSPEALRQNDIRDSMMNNAFGVAQDLKLRSIDWGYSLSDVRQPVYMRHSKTDDSVPYRTAVRTAELLPHCELELTESGPHFSQEVLDDFICNTIAPHI